MQNAPPLSLILDFARTESPDDPFAFRFAPQTYTLRRADGGIARLELEWSRELLADLEALRRPRSDPALRQRLGDFLADFVEPSGWRDRSAAIVRALEAGRAVHLTIRSGAAELYALPWEIMTRGGSGLALAEHPRLLIRYAWPATSSATESPSPRREGGRILYAWSAAGGEVPAADHQRALARAAAINHLSFEADRDVVAHASLARLHAALADRSAPTSILHLLAHGGAKGSTFGLLLDGEGEAATVDAAALRQALAPAAGSLRLVVLSACHGGDSGDLGNHLGSVAQALHRAGIQAVIASRYPLSIPGSNVLTESLYGSLLGGPTSLEDAFLAARDRLATLPEGVDADSLQLYARPEDGEDTRPLILRPYRGLLAFDAGHSRFFFGRDAERKELLADLKTCVDAGKPRLLLVAGASGTGKSSVVLAAALPDLLGGAGPWPGARWEHAVLRPGEAPIAALEEALSQRQDRARPFLLIVDQFEEVFTHVAAVDERQAFARRLWALARDDTGVACIVTIRVDFLGRCGELVLDDEGNRLDRLVFDPVHLTLIPQMRPEQLRAVIEGPAALCGLTLQEGLAARLLADAGEEPGALPLLQYTLDRLWERREGPILSNAAYEALGGVAGALESRAEELCAAMPPGQLRQTRRLFLRLVHLDEDGGALTRRRAELASLRPRDLAGDPDFEAALARFIDARLLVKGQVHQTTTVEVAHEALVRTWSRLKAWIDEDRAKIGDLAKLESWLAEWRDDQVLLSGNQLAYALGVADRYPDELTAELRDLLLRSQRRATYYRWLGRGALISTLVGLVIAALVYREHALDSERQREMTLRQRDYFKTVGIDMQQRSAIGEARRLALAIDRDDPTRAEMSLLLGVEALRATEAVDLPPEPQALTGLYGVVAYRPIGVALEGSAAPLAELSISRDGGRVLGRSETGVVHLWDAARPTTPRILSTRVDLQEAALSPDGARVILRDDGPLRIEAWDGEGPPIVLPGADARLLGFTADGREVLTMSGARLLRWSALAAGAPTPVDERPVTRASLSRDRRSLVILREIRGDDPYTTEARIRILDLVGGRPPIDLTTYERPREEALLLGGEVLVRRADGGASILTPRTGGSAALRLPEGFEALRMAADPKGRYAALLGFDGRLLLVDLADLAEGGTPPLELRGPGPQVPFGYTADGRWLVIGREDGGLTLRGASGAGAERTSAAHRDAVQQLAFADRGDAFASAGADNTVRVWRAQAPIPGIVSTRGSASALAFTPDGNQVIAALDDGIEVIVADGRGDRLRLDTGGAATACLDLDAAGRLLVAAEPGGTARLWDLRRPGAPLTFAPPTPTDGGCARLSPDGARLLTGIGGATLELRPSAGGEATTIPHDQPVLSAMFTGDGRIVGVERLRLLVWPATGGAPLARELASGVDGRAPLVLDPAGERALVIHYDGSLSVWSLTAARPPQRLRLEDQYFTQARFTPDGAAVIAAAVDLVRFPLDGRSSPTVLRGHESAASFLGFTPAGRLVSASYDATARLWGADAGGVVTIPLRDQALAGALSPDGRTLALALPDAIELWPLDPEALTRAACALAGRELTEAEWASIMATRYRSTCGDDSPLAALTPREATTPAAIAERIGRFPVVLVTALHQQIDRLLYYGTSDFAH